MKTENKENVKTLVEKCFGAGTFATLLGIFCLKTGQGPGTFAATTVTITGIITIVASLLAYWQIDSRKLTPILTLLKKLGMGILRTIKPSPK